MSRIIALLSLSLLIMSCQGYKGSSIQDKTKKNNAVERSASNTMRNLNSTVTNSHYNEPDNRNLTH